MEPPATFPAQCPEVPGAGEALYSACLCPEHIISRYEYARLVGARVSELYRNGPTRVSGTLEGSPAAQGLTHAQNVAQREFAEGLLPMLLVRRLPGGLTETRASRELQLISRAPRTSAPLGAGGAGREPSLPPRPEDEAQESSGSRGLASDEGPPLKMARKSKRRQLANQDLHIGVRVREEVHDKGRRSCGVSAPDHP